MIGRPASALPARASRSAREHALAVLRVRGAALAVAVLPAALAVVLAAGAASGPLRGAGWDTARWVTAAVAAVTALLAVGVAVTLGRARPAASPTVPVEEGSAPGLYTLIRDLAERLAVPVPSGVALTPDCDSWLEDRPPRDRRGNPRAAPVLVIGSPFLWWMREGELRALLAPVVAGTGPAAHPDIAAARHFVRRLDAAVADAGPPAAGGGRTRTGRLRTGWLRAVGRLARILLRACGEHPAEMERGVALAAADRARGFETGVRVVAQEQVGLAYAGWDRLLTRVALPAWRSGRWPSGLTAGAVSALTELSRRDRLADGLAPRLGERPACDLLEEPGAVDASVSLLAARLFHGQPGAERAPDWAPVDWASYPEEVVDRTWRREAARLFAALDADPGPGQDPPAPTLARVLAHLSQDPGGRCGKAVATRVSTAAAREDALRDGSRATRPDGDAPVTPPAALPRAPRGEREVMADHVTAVVCCAAVDTARGAPGLDWLDGPALLLGGRRAADLTRPVRALVEDGDAAPLRDWLDAAGIRADKPLRLV